MASMTHKELLIKTMRGLAASTESLLRLAKLYPDLFAGNAEKEFETAVDGFNKLLCAEEVVKQRHLRDIGKLEGQ